MQLLISGCLLGLRCRYDGERRPLKEEQLALLRQHFSLIPVCPEQLGGLSTPRDPSERQGDRVVSAKGRDVTEEYRRGAAEALSIAKQSACSLALLKEKSPSCGKGLIYDGSFQRRLTQGQGVTVELLEANGITVYGESQIEDLLRDFG